MCSDEKHTSDRLAENATFSLFQATDGEFEVIFARQGQNLELVEDFVERVGEQAAGLTLASLWQRPIFKEDVQGVQEPYSTALDTEPSIFPLECELDRDPGQLNDWQHLLYSQARR